MPVDGLDIPPAKVIMDATEQSAMLPLERATIRKVRARIIILISWGIVAIATGFVRTVPQLYLARFLLGLAEAGFFPGIVLYLTYWFRQREQARSIALFMTAQPVTSIVGAPISGLILDHIHWFGASSWRWLLILEGLPAIVCGIAAYHLMPSRPSDASFLTESEKQWLDDAIARESEEKARRHSTSALVAMLVVSHSSDRRKERRFHAAIPLTIGGTGFLLLGALHTPVVALVLVSLAAIGVYSFFGPFFSTPSDFLTGFAAASGIALITSVANLGGFVGPYVVGFISRRTGNLYGGLAFAGAAMLASAILFLVLPRAPTNRAPKGA